MIKAADRRGDAPVVTSRKPFWAGDQKTTLDSGLQRSKGVVSRQPSGAACDVAMRAGPPPRPHGSLSAWRYLHMPVARPRLPVGAGGDARGSAASRPRTIRRRMAPPRLSIHRSAAHASRRAARGGGRRKDWTGEGMSQSAAPCFRCQDRSARSKRQPGVSPRCPKGGHLNPPSAGSSPRESRRSAAPVRGAVTTWSSRCFWNRTPRR